MGEQLSQLKRLSKIALLVLLIVAVSFSCVAVYFLYPIGADGITHMREGGAAIVDALSELNPNPSFEETIAEYLTSAGMYVDVYRSSTVSVEFMKSFPAGYDLVVFRVHSGTSRHGVFYFTSETYDESKYQPEQYRDELRPARDYEGHAQVFAFGAKFVDAYLKDRFQNAMIVGMGCFGAGTSYGTGEEVALGDFTVETRPNLADAFHRQGAKVVIGWDGLVNLSFSDETTLHLLKALAVDRLSVRDAVELTNRTLGPDPAYKSKLTFYPDTAGDDFLTAQATQDIPQEEAKSRLLQEAEVLRPWIHAPESLVSNPNGNEPAC
jgi:hypothetical protein